MNKKLIFASLFAAVVLAACGKKDAPAPAAAPAAPAAAPAASEAAAPASAASK